MVLQHARSYPQSSRPHPNPNPTRIVGMAGAIALNVALLMLLLVPLSAPISTPIGDVIVPDWRPREKKPEPERPQPIPIVRPQPKPQPQVRQDVAQPIVDQVVIDEGSLLADPIVEQAVTASAEPSIEPSGPVSGVRLEYANAPSPPYPIDALRAGLEGVVMLQILVDTDGRPLEVSIHKSSGHRMLDEAARRFVLKRWTFTPAMKDGRAVQAIGIVPIDFNLGRQ